jgi:HIV Tat-specific factor 1
MAANEPPLPTSVEEFNRDDRISFSRLDDKYLAVLEDGSELEFNPRTRTWVTAEEESMEEDLAEASRTGSNTPGDASGPSRKRSAPPSNGNDDANSEAPNKRARPAKKAKPPPQPRQNTAVYVTGLPPDATVDEIHDLFSRKGGVIAEEIDSGRPRIKMYTGDDGEFKGDALVVFFKPQSVEMAIMLLDDTDFRFSDTGLGTGKMRVQAAEASYKKVQYDEEGNQITAKGKGKEAPTNGTGTAADRARANADRQKIIKKTQKLAAKLADWSDDEPSAAVQAEAQAAKHKRVVVLRHMFTQAELEEDPAALLDIKEDVREECEKLGAVTNVVLYDEEPDGIVSVKFRKPEAALACVQMMDGRAFDGRVVRATISTGEKFKKSTNGGGGSDEDED